MQKQFKKFHRIFTFSNFSISKSRDNAKTENFLRIGKFSCVDQKSI